MIDKIIKNKCTGCSACYSVCPKSAIRMQENEEGFYRPVVDETLCVSCELCLKKCPAIVKPQVEGQDPSVFAAWNTDKSIRKNSTSGGVFSALATAVIRDGGVVVGAIYTDDFSIEHTVISNTEDIEKLRQSKYAQSNPKDVFVEIKKHIKDGTKVLFCGTPCQNAGLKNIVGDNENIFYCDFICRGVASPKVYRKFISDIGRGAKPKKIQFKNKDFGWNRFSTKITFGDDSIYHKDRDDDYYMRGYLKHNLYLQPSCYNCQFKTLPRYSDISLGDFWGIGNYEKKLDTDEGTSVIIVNSQKGKKLLDSASQDLYIEKRSIDEITAGNMCLLNSTVEGEYNKYFFKNINKYSFDKLICIIDEKSLHLSKKEKVGNIVKRIKEKVKNSDE